jgi:hypothetical protein
MTSKGQSARRGRRIISLMTVSLLLATFAATAQADNASTDDQLQTECLREHTVVISSGTDTMVTAGNSGAPVPHPAVLAWEPFADTDPSHWDVNIDHEFAEGDWIWESYRVVNPVEGDIVEFERAFSIPGDPISGSLAIAVDNGYEAHLNDAFVGTANLTGDWRTGNLRWPHVDGLAWQTAGVYDVTAGLVEGNNVLAITGVNEFMDPTDEFNTEFGTIINNPAGVIYELEITYQTNDCPLPPCPQTAEQPQTCEP